MLYRNYEQRRVLQDRIMEMQRLHSAALEAIPDDLSDEEWDKACDEIDREYDVTSLATKKVALEYKECRNAWFREFVQSFGLCESRRITRKQAEVFARYSEEGHVHRGGRGTDYYVRVGKLFIKTALFTEREPGYVTIKELI